VITIGVEGALLVTVRAKPKSLWAGFVSQPWKESIYAFCDYRHAFTPHNQVN
jgi:hypothetical protein